MTRFLQIVVVAALAVITVAQDAAFQQGLSLHNQQLQDHIRKEQEQQRQVQQFSASLPQQQYQPQGQYQQPNPQYNQYSAPVQEEGQYNAEYYNNPNNFINGRSNHIQANPEQSYQAGLAAHQQQIQEHLRKEGSHQPQAFQQPAYQQQAYQQPAYQQQQAYSQPAYQGAPSNTAADFQAGLAAHQRQIQEHLAKEKSHPSQVAYQG